MGTGAQAKKRVVSGMRPTGRLHIGHYFGALENWVRLQNDPEYECFYFIADWHALTSDYADTSGVASNTIEIMTDYLAAGLDPAKSVIFQQSLVPEHAELHLLLGMVTPLSWLERVPTYKEALEQVKDKDLHNYGFLGYPCLQTADIVIYSEEGAQLYVPVGEDQVSHVELSREIVRKFNLHNLVLDAQKLAKYPENLVAIEHSFGDKSHGGYGGVGPVTLERILRAQITVRRRVAEVGVENWLRQVRPEENVEKFEEFTSRNPIGSFLKRVLVEPEHQLTKTPRIPGTDGRKMSKSYNNYVSLSESNESIWEKVRPMKTDPARIRRTDKGDPDKCPVYDWHKLFSTKETLDWAAHGCRTAEIGCIDCKKKMVEHLVQWIAPVRERRLYYEGKKRLVREIIQDGSVEARRVAQQTMRRVRDAVFGKERILRKTTVSRPPKSKGRAGSNG